MSQDLDLYENGGLQPYQPGGLDLYSPSAEDVWQNDPDYLTDHALAPAQQQQVEQNLQQIASVFETDMAGLGFVQQDIQKCIAWFRQNLANPTPRMPARKSKYQLWQYSNDAAMNHFALYAEQQGFSQQFIQSICYWVQQLETLMAGQQVRAQVRAPAGNSAEAIMDSLDDKTYDYVLRHNETVKGQTEAYLRAKWQDSYTQNIALANSYLANLPESHRAHFDQFEPGTWTLSLNSATTIEGLFQMAVGGHNLPSGSALQTEIQQIEQLMRTNRAAYNKDLQIQGRLRTLYSIRDGGR